MGCIETVMRTALMLHGLIIRESYDMTVGL